MASDRAEPGQARAVSVVVPEPWPPEIAVWRARVDVVLRGPQPAWADVRPRDAAAPDEEAPPAVVCRDRNHRE